MNSRTARVLGLGAVMLAAAAAMTMPAQADDHGYLDDALEYVDVPYCAGYLELYDRDYCASPSRWTSSNQHEDMSDEHADMSDAFEDASSGESEEASSDEGEEASSEEGEEASSDEGEDMSSDEREDMSSDAPGDITFADGTVQDD
ncbi:hypothetical protein [Nonomuraea sp. NPDC052265]|uniref:hypothetical protein n=1 Tax=Nonomuraea sp. NPDC052265 TaxID=3364374 RepID=UPI0037C7D3A6